MNFVRRKVSLNKRRYQENGYDLDLAYITNKVIAMGFPSQGIEGLYRNPLSQVRRFLEWRHKSHYKVYNLCIEREYDVAKFASRVGRYPFSDHQAPPLTLIPQFCNDVDTWLGKDENNVAAIHCKAGKGRAGMMVCCYLLHSGVVDTAIDAMNMFAEKRTHDGEGVTIPSQRRYVCYYELVKKNGFPQYPTITLESIRIKTTMYINPAGSAPYAKIYNGNEEKELLVTAPVKVEKGGDAVIDCKDLQITGDIKVVLFDKIITKGKEKEMAHFYFNTAFIEGNQLSMTKKEIDKVVSDKKHKKFKPEFEIQVTFKGAEENVFTKAQKSGTKLETQVIDGKQEDEMHLSVENQQSLKEDSGSLLMVAPVDPQTLESDDDSYSDDDN